jgi:hypothetical protein
MRMHPMMEEFHHSGLALARPESLTTIAMRSTLVAESPFQILGPMVVLLKAPGCVETPWMGEM